METSAGGGGGRSLRQRPAPSAGHSITGATFRDGRAWRRWRPLASGGAVHPGHVGCIVLPAPNRAGSNVFHIWKKPEPVPAGRKPVALVVDASEGFRHAALRLLARANVAGVAVNTVAAAVAWLRANDAPALVLVDVAQVAEVCAALGGRRSAVIATADIGVDRREQRAALDAGAAGMLVKPLEPVEFLRTIDGIVATAAARKRVLLVDDDDDIREAFAMFLEDEGYDVTPAAHGRDAMDALDGGLKPDVILMDLMMPVMNGWEMWDRLKRSRHAHTPVVVITAGQDAGPVPAPVLRKPIGMVELLTVVKRAS